MNKLFLSFLLLPIQLLTQTIHEGLEFSRTTFNFPKAENWVSRIDTIEVTNLTNKKVHLLRQDDPKNFELRFPQKSIDPGNTETIEVIFAPKEKGKFNYTFLIYHSASLTPVTVTYKGEILGFDEFADAACPSFTKTNLKPVAFELEINVIDSTTKKSLGNSFLEITKGEYYTQTQTDANGYFREKSTINYYTVLAEHSGYKSRSIARHINPKNRKITIKLPPSTTTPTPEIVTTITPPVELAGNASTALPLAEYKKNNIVFLIDKSSSMNKPDCMPLLQMAMTQLANMTRSEDRITIITYANEAKVVLPGMAGSENTEIIAVIDQLKCGGRTEGGKAIHTAYRNAQENFIQDGVNQIIIATDGGFNGLTENEAEMMALVSSKAKEGIMLSVLAFGQNRFGKAHIARLAKQGEGFYEFISDEEDAKIKLTETVKTQSKVK